MYDFDWRFDPLWEQDGIAWFAYGVDRPHPASVLTYHQAKLESVRRRLAGVSKAEYLSHILARLLEPSFSPQQQVEVLIRFVQDAMWHNPLEQPMQPGAERYADHYAHEQLPLFADISGEQFWLGGVMEAHELLELHEGRCGHQAQVLVQLSRQAGFEARPMQLFHHRVAEVFYDGNWHYCDPDVFKHGVVVRKPDGTLPSLAWLADDAHRYLADALPPDGILYSPEQLCDSAGQAMTGAVCPSYTSGLLPYYSYYLAAPEECPPAVPALRPPQVGHRAVTLAWQPATYREGEAPHYEVDLFRAGEVGPVQVWRDLTATAVTALELASGEYRWAVRAVDGHRRHNPATWYYPAWGAFGV